VAIARTGFGDVGVFEPLVGVGGQPATPLLAMLWILLGVVLLVAGAGEVNERGLRFGGVLLGVAGAVWLIEPAAVTPYLGIDRDSGAVRPGRAAHRRVLRPTVVGRPARRLGGLSGAPGTPPGAGSTRDAALPVSGSAVAGLRGPGLREVVLCVHLVPPRS
jgi:hypothetical protein